MILKVLLIVLNLLNNTTSSQRKNSLSLGSFYSWKLCSAISFADRWTAARGERKMTNFIGMSQEGKVSVCKSSIA